MLNDKIPSPQTRENIANVWKRTKQHGCQVFLDVSLIAL